MQHEGLAGTVGWVQNFLFGASNCRPGPVARETPEESRIECAITGVVGIYSDPKHVILYTRNGEVRQEFSIVLTAANTEQRVKRGPLGPGVRAP